MDVCSPKDGKKMTFLKNFFHYSKGMVQNGCVDEVARTSVWRFQTSGNIRRFMLPKGVRVSKSGLAVLGNTVDFAHLDDLDDRGGL